MSVAVDHNNAHVNGFIGWLFQKQETRLWTSSYQSADVAVKEVF